ncbi:ABC transporter substrate-binding protein [Pseudosulfitobacter sp. DSM 107133]|uniref:ABC transporter substrate-binding protein n=1 Tax=Pseudosulfitobacter sp. DSM 107133 TaxID=2883100 RepID=UPI000DF48AE4|nr:ABC transporter substrate-binding protein [Pseudosulfitobacter sp. DSM 107133]UOA29741.1 Heme-binding protein A [Pseudosulfitobacter sp. DSM 107133]
MKNSMRKLGALTAASAALIASAAFADKATDTLNVAWDGQLTNADSYYNANRPGIMLSRMVWDQLIERDPDTFEYQPSLATEWRWINDLTLEFELREGIFFHNGEPFDADDVVYTFNFISNPANKIVNPTVGSWIDHVEKVDQYKVRIHLSNVFPAALEFLSSAMPIYPNEYYAEVGPEGMANAPVGTGPYKIESIEAGVSVSFMINEDYWTGSPKGMPQIGRVVVTYPADKTTAMAELMSGSLDWMWYVPADQVENLASVPGLTVTSGETMRVGYMNLDTMGRSGESPLQDVRVRQAIAHSINREEFADAFFPPSATTLKAFCFPTQFGCYQGAQQYDYDVDRARELMADAGYSDGFPTSLYAYRQPTSWAEALGGYMGKLGISTSIQVLQYSAFRTKVQEGNVPISFGDWGSYSINDASAILDNFFTGTLDDYAGDEEVSEWITKASESNDPAVREALYKQAIDRIMEQAYIVPLNSFGVFYAYSDDLNFTSHRDEIPRYYLYSWKD